MSTRSIIARQFEDGFEGVYHHWDGYPSGLGATLYELYHSLGANLELLLEEVIDKHPSGWISLNKTETSKSECFCHKVNPDNDMQVVTDLSDVNAVYAYAFEKDVHKEADLMHVYLRKYDYDSDATSYEGFLTNARWLRIASIDLIENMPDWNELDKRGETVLERVSDIIL